MSKIVFLFILISLSFSVANAQSGEIQRQRTVEFNDSTLKKNAIYLSLGSGAQSLIYEVNFANAKRSAWYFKAGLGFNQEFFASNSQHVMAGVTYLTGRQRKSHFEMSTGAILMFQAENYRYDQSVPYGNQSLSDYLNINMGFYMGYRYQKPGGRFIFRIGSGYPEITAISFGFAF